MHSIDPNESKSDQPTAQHLLVVARLAGRRQRFELRPGENLIGSAPSCEVRLDHPSISRTHASLVVGDRKLQVADAGSTNGTFLDGQPVRGVATFEAGPEIRRGCASLGVEEVDVAPSPLHLRRLRRIETWRSR